MNDFSSVFKYTVLLQERVSPEGINLHSSICHAADHPLKTALTPRLITLLSPASSAIARTIYIHNSTCQKHCFF